VVKDEAREEREYKEIFAETSKKGILISFEFIFYKFQL